MKVDRDKGIKFLLILCPNWVVCPTSAIGNYGGLAAMWNPSLFSLKA